MYAALGMLVGAMKLWAERFAATGYPVAVVAAAVVSAVAFATHGDDAAALRPQPVPAAGPDPATASPAAVT